MPNKLPSTKELGDSQGIASTGTVTNVDYNNRLTGSSGVRWYNQMRLGDGTVSAVLQVMKLPILSAGWYVKPGSQKRADIKIAEFVQQNLWDGLSRSFQETLSEILLHLDWGRCPMEKVWEFDETGELIKLKKLGMITPETVYSWKLKDGRAGIQQSTVNGDFEIPMEKLVVFTNKKEGDNWEGISVLRSAFKHWDYKEKLYKVQAMAAEKQGMGIPYGKKPMGATPEDINDVEKLLKNVHANHAQFMIFPEGWDIGFMDMKAGTTKDVSGIISNHNREILLNMLAQFLDLGSGATGSYSLSQDQSKLFLLSLESVAKYVRDTLNKFVVRELVDYNFEVTDYPTLEFDQIGTVDHSALSTSIQRLVQVGALKVDEGLAIWLRNAMGLPEEDGTAEVDVNMADDMIAELTMSMDTLETGDEPAEDPTAGATDEQIVETASEAGLDITLFGGAVGKPFSDETKKKISEALKKDKGPDGAGGKGKKKKVKNPEIAKKQKEITKLRKEVTDFSNQSRRELLEMKSQGKKLSPEDSAKKQLELMDRKNSISSKIDKLKGEIDEMKSKDTEANAPKDSKAPAPKDKKAHDHDTQPTSDMLLKAAERLYNALDATK